MEKNKLWCVGICPEDDSPHEQSPAVSKEIAERALARYRATVNQHGVRFFCEVVNKNFPRDVVIAGTGRLNKPATQLFEEFKKYDPFSEVA
ncbi:hypothetical protein [Acinetobacter lwoffii]|uniref:hypothetical protein n=1 Tax=Acinetobacter lwoffii TaxID=28090 RepID=UPI0030CF4438